MKKENFRQEYIEKFISFYLKNEQVDWDTLDNFLDYDFLKSVHDLINEAGTKFEYADVIEGLPPEFINELPDDIVKQAINEGFCITYWFTKDYFTSEKVKMIYSHCPAALGAHEYPEVLDVLSNNELIKVIESYPANFVGDYHAEYTAAYYEFFSRRLGFEKLISTLLPGAVTYQQDYFNRCIKDRIGGDPDGKYQYMQMLEVYEPALKYAIDNKIVTLEFIKIMKKNGFSNFEHYNINIKDVILT